MKSLSEQQSRYPFACIQFYAGKEPVLWRSKELPPLEVIAAASDSRDQQWVVVSPCLRGKARETPFWSDGPVPAGSFTGVPDACCDYVGVAHARTCDGGCWPVLHNNPVKPKIPLKKYPLALLLPAEIPVSSALLGELRDLLCKAMWYYLDVAECASERERKLAELAALALEEPL